MYPYNTVFEIVQLSLIREMPWFQVSLVPQTPIRTHADRGSGNIMYNELF